MWEQLETSGSLGKEPVLTAGYHSASDEGLHEGLEHASWARQQQPRAVSTSFVPTGNTQLLRHNIAPGTEALCPEPAPCEDLQVTALCALVEL